MADERTCARSRDIDRLEDEYRDLSHELRDKYVTEKVFNARVGPLEQRGSSTWLSNRNALLAFASMIAGVIATVYIARGGH